MQLTVSGGNGTNTWTTTPVSGSLPPGWSISASGVLSGPTAPTAGQAGTYTFTLAVKDSGTYGANLTLTVTINPAPAITFGAAPTATGTYNTAYSSGVSATGGAGALTYAVTSGSLPTGLNPINSTTGAITGTPTTVGTYNFKVTATDGFGDSMVSPQYTIVVSYPAMNITTSTLPTGYIGSVYAGATLAATGGSGLATNYTWTKVSGPAGLVVSAAGVVSGTPTGTTTGSLNMVVSVTDSTSTLSTQATLPITIDAAVSITPAAEALPTAYANSAYTSPTLTAAGGSGTGYTWSVNSGSSLPSWLSLSATSGATTTLTGTPTAVASAASFTLKVTDSVGNTATVAYNVAVAAGISISPVTGTTLAEAYANSPYTSVPLTASGGNGTYTWSVVSGSAPPSWMSLSATSGSSINLTGTPTAGASAATFGLKVTDTAGNSATVSYSITVGTGIGVSPVTGTSLTAYAGSAYTSTTLSATGGSGTYTWSVASGSSLPSWLSLSSTSGATTTLTGNPTTVATAASFTLKVADTAGNSQTVTYSITVDAGISISPVTGTTLATAYASSPYTSIPLTASGGSGTGYTWSVVSGSAPPSWLSLSATSGASTTMTGTPTAAAPAANFSLKVTDSAGNSQTVIYSITVNTGISISPATGTTLATAYANSPYTSIPLTASGGSTAGYTWSVVSGSAPPSWMSLSATSGNSITLTGTPTAAAPAANFSLKVTDSAGNSRTVLYSITVNTGIGISPVTGTALTAYAGSAYTSPTLTATGGSTAGYTWSVSSGSLPSWLSLSSTSGATTTLTGNPTTVATAVSFSLKVTDSLGNTQTVNYSITVSAGISITPPTGALPEAYAHSAYSSGNLTASGGSGTGYTWSVSSGSLPSWLSFSSTSGASTTLTGTPTAAASAASFTLKVTDSVGNSATIAYNVTVGAGITITPPAIPTFYPGASYATTTYTAAGGAGGPYTWSWAPALGSALPSGLSLSTTGTITGTPANATSSSVTSQLVITAQDSGGNTATINATIAIEATLTISTASPLPTGSVGSTYSQALAATGGTGAGTYVWSVPLSADQTCLTARGLALSSAGVLSSTGVLTSGDTGTCTSFGVQVNDNNNVTPYHTASKSFTVAVSNFTITITTPPPAFAVDGKSYSSGTFTATGGTGPYTWSIAQGSGFSTLPIGLGLGNTSAATNAITGTVTSSDPTGAYNFTVTVVDHNGLTATYPYTLTVYSQPVQTPAPNPLPSPVNVNQAYTASTITASGGSGNYSWAVSGNLTSVLTVSNNGNNLSISGTPTKVGTYDLYVTLTDTTTSVSTAQIDYTITVNEPNPVTLPAPNPTSLPAATQSVQYTGAINAGGGTAPYTWTINGVTVTAGGISLSNGLSASTTGGNTLSITGTPTTLTSVSLTDVIVTDTYGSTISPPGVSYSITVNPAVPTGYNVSGKVIYAGSDTGWVYLELSPNSGCSDCNQVLGTAVNGTTASSLLSPGVAFTIHGVPTGTYTLKAWLDNIGHGAQNASNPTVSISNVVVTSSGLSGQSVTLADPSAVSLGTLAPGFDSNNGLGTFSGGAVVGFDPICNGSGCSNGGVEMPASYEVQYSTNSSFTGTPGSKCFPATGSGGTSPYIITGLTNSQTYYFRAAGNVGICGSSTTGLNYSAAEPSGGLTIGAPSTGSLLSGTVTFTLPTGVSASGKTLYVGCYDSNTAYVYADPIASPVSPQPYSVDVPNGTACQVFGFIDLNNSGLIGGPGEISNTSNGIGMAAVTVNGATSQNITLPSGNSVVEIKTDVSTGSGGTNYGVGFQVYGEYKLPVAVELLSETPDVNGTVVDVVIPADIATDAFNGNSDEFDYWPPVTGTPVVGDSYTFNVTYSDGTSEQLTAAVTGVLNAFATSLSPTGTGVSLTPNFSWDYPSSASSYVYQFELDVNNGGTVWAIPPQHSSSNGFASTISPFITWDVDPTNTGDLPDSSYLSSGALLASTTYNWSIAAYDANMNEAQTQVSFTTTAGSLTLPAGNTGYALINTPYEQSISASGGLGTYTFTVNGTTITASTAGTAQPITTGGNGLSAFSSGSQLTAVGTPTAGPITLNVSVTDGTNTTSQTYTINVATLPTPGAGNANNAKLNGTYVCKMDGYNDSDGSRWASLTSFVANGSGGITGGVWDTNSRSFSAAMGGTISSTSSYNVGSDNMGVLTMNSVITSGGTGTHTSNLAIALNDANGATSTATEFRMAEIDDVGATPSGMHSSGVCYQATPADFTNTASASYSYAMQGETASTALPVAIVGRYDASGTTISNGAWDLGVAVAGAPVTTGTSTGSYTAPDTTYGRFTSQTQPDGETTYWNHYVVYIIDSNRMFMLETDPISTAHTYWQQLLSGEIRKQLQTANTAPVLLNGSSILYGQGYEISGGSVSGYKSNVYQVSGTGNGHLNVNASYDDDAGAYSAGSENGQTVTVTFYSANPGRATFSPGSDSAFLYFFNAGVEGGGGAGSAFYLDSNSSTGYLETGWLESQTQTTFTNAALAGDYLLGKLPPMGATNNDAVGELNLLSNGSATFGVTTAGVGDFSWDQTVSGAYSWASTTYGTFTTGTGNKDFSCAVISSTKIVCITNGSGSAEMMILQQ
jgi:hypothetical protein